MGRSESGRRISIDSELLETLVPRIPDRWRKVNGAILALERVQRFRYTVARAGASPVVTRELLQ